MEKIIGRTLRGADPRLPLLTATVTPVHSKQVKKSSEKKGLPLPCVLFCHHSSEAMTRVNRKATPWLLNCPCPTPVPSKADIGMYVFFLRSKDMKSLFARFMQDQSGATAIEYGLIAALISVVAITTLTSVGTKLNAKFTSVSNGLN
jgi:pilus assembly protein Flp/PilA